MSREFHPEAVCGCRRALDLNPGDTVPEANLRVPPPAHELPRAASKLKPASDEDVDQVTVLVDRTPQLLALTVDRDEDFVQEPRIAESTLTSLQLPSVVWAEFPAPLPNGFVRHDDAPFGQQILDVPEAQTVSVVQPHGVADDVRRKAMPKVAGSSRVHPGIVPRGELT